MMTTPEDRAAFDRLGYLDGPRILSDLEADELTEQCRRMVLDPDHPKYASVPRALTEPFLHVPHIEIDHPAFWGIHTNPALVDTICELLEVDEVQLFERHLFYKPPFEDRVRSWHQDTAYLPFMKPYRALAGVGIVMAKGRRPVVCGTRFSGHRGQTPQNGATAENGALVMVPGSHTMGDLPPELDRDLSDEALRDAGVAEGGVYRPVPKGYVHLHHPAVWHGSGGNLTERPRAGLSLMFAERGTRFDATGRFAHFFSGTHGEPLDEALHAVCR